MGRQFDDRSAAVDGSNHPAAHDAGWSTHVVDLKTPPHVLDTRNGSKAHVTVLYEGDPVGTLILETPFDTHPIELVIRRSYREFGGRIVDAAIESVLPRHMVPKPRPR